MSTSKYAALVFGDDERQPKAASSKLSSPEPGQIVRGIDGSVYRVASKIAGPGGFAVKLASLQGKPATTPPDFRPVGFAAARLASWLKFHLAYNRHFDRYINSYIERHNQQVAERNREIERANSGNPERKPAPLEEPLPFPVGSDGKAYDWAGWFQNYLSPKIHIPGHGDAEDKQIIKDELIHEMLSTVFGHRDILSQFVAKAESLHVNKQNAAQKLTKFLISVFSYASRDEMRRKIREQFPPEEISMWQPGGSDEGEGEINLLETEEHGVGEKEFQSFEAKQDMSKFREGFRKWLAKPNVAGPEGAENFILLFDIFWRILQDAEGVGDIKRGEFEQEWMEKTGLSWGSFKGHFMRLPEMIEQFIMTHKAELGDKSLLVDLMSAIRTERAKQKRKEERKKQREQPAMVSSLNTAGVEGDFTEAISNTENPDVVDPDIYQPTESVSEAAKKAAGEYNPYATYDRLKKHYDDTHEVSYEGGRARVVEKKEKLTCMKCHRTSDASDSNNLQCPHCGGNMKTAEYSQEDWERDERSQYDLERAEEAKHWEGEDDEKTASASKIAQKLLRGDQLTPEMAKQVRDAFIYRWTSDNKRRGDVYHCDKCDVRNDPYVNTTSAEGHQHPTIPLTTDAEWLKNYAFCFTNANKLLPNMHAVPAYLAPESEAAPVVASVAHKFAMEKAAYNPGKGEYVYQADVYCEECGEAYKRALGRQGKAPQNPGDEASYDTDDYPKGPYYNQESDYPQYCSRCDAFLEQPLTDDGYRQLNQMILEHEADGKGQSDIIDELKAFYPEREDERYEAHDRAVDESLRQVEQDTDKDFLRGLNTAGKKKAMIPHEFNNADGQAIRNETQPSTDYVEGEADTAEFRQNRVGAGSNSGSDDDRGAGDLWREEFYEHRTKGLTTDGLLTGMKQADVDPSSILDVERRTPTPLHKRPQDPAHPTHPLQTREAEPGSWQCMDCGAVGLLGNKGGGCETCGSQAVFPVSPTGVESPELVRETSPIETEKRMIPRRTKPINAGKKTAQGGNTTVTMQNQNATVPDVPGKSQPMAVPDAIDQSAGPHSPNAPSTAPRTPALQPRIVDVPPGTEGEAEMTASAKHAAERFLATLDPKTAASLKGWPTKLILALAMLLGSGGDIKVQVAKELQSRGQAVPAQLQNAQAQAAPVESVGEMTIDPMPAKPSSEEIVPPTKPGYNDNTEFISPEENAKPGAKAEHAITHPGQFAKSPKHKDMTQASSSYLEEPSPEEETGLECPRCHGSNIDIDAAEDGYSIYCEDCEQVTHSGNLVHGQPRVDEHEASDPADLNSSTLPQIGESDENLQKERWLEKHGWVRENEHHGATWWMEKQMWSKKDHEEEIPYQDTDDAVQKELDLMENSKTSSACPSGKAKYSDEDAAVWAIEAQNGNRQQRGLAPIRLYVYRCPHCGSFHLTKNSQKPAIKKPPADEQQWLEETKNLGFKSSSRENPAFDALDGVWTSPDQAPTDEEIEILGNYLADSDLATGVPSGVMLAEKWRQARWAVSGDDDRSLLKSMGIQAAAAIPAAPAAPPPPNVQQNMSIARPPVPGAAPGATMAIMPGQGQGEEPGGITRHTVEPDLPNAKYHMQGAEELVAAEQDRLAKQAFGVDTPPCAQCGKIKPDTMWHVFETLGDMDDPTKSLEGFYCEDCALDLAQGI